MLSMFMIRINNAYIVCLMYSIALFWSAYKVIFRAFADLETHKNFDFILDKLYKKDNNDNNLLKVISILFMVN